MSYDWFDPDIDEPILDKEVWVYDEGTDPDHDTHSVFLARRIERLSTSARLEARSTGPIEGPFVWVSLDDRSHSSFQVSAWANISSPPKPPVKVWLDAEAAEQYLQNLYDREYTDEEEGEKIDEGGNG